MSKPKWKIGDVVRRIDNRRYVRCGYPKHLPDVADDILTNKRDKIGDALRAFGLPVPQQSIFGYDPVPDRVARRMASALAYTELYYTGFGGKQRTIHETEETHLWHSIRPNPETALYAIIGRFHVMTGDYYGPSGDYDSYEPGGLLNQKRNTILVLTGWWPTINLDDYRPEAKTEREYAEHYLCVWDIRVEKVTEGLPTTSPNSESRSDRTRETVHARPAPLGKTSSSA